MSGFFYLPEDRIREAEMHEKEQESIRNKKAARKYPQDPTSQLVLKLRVAIENATPKSGSFPLIVYHQGLGATISDNQAFCEYLASHGYVVCNSAFQGNNTKWPIVDGSESNGIPDINIIVETARSHPFVSTNILGLMGHSAGATLCMRYAAVGKYKPTAIALYDQSITIIQNSQV